MIDVNILKLPKKMRNMNKEELVNYISKEIKLEHDFLNKLELDEIQYLLIQIKKYGNNLTIEGFAIGKFLF